MRCLVVIEIQYSVVGVFCKRSVCLAVPYICIIIWHCVILHQQIGLMYGKCQMINRVATENRLASIIIVSAFCQTGTCRVVLPCISVPYYLS